MKRRMESRKATRGGAGAQEENGHAIRLFSTGEQFLTRSCARCAGLLVNEWCYDLDYAGLQQPEFLRCVQCGHRVDAVIVQNQMRPRSRNIICGECNLLYPSTRKCEIRSHDPQPAGRESES